MSNNNSIGVFDSGIGGLTVLKAMKTFMPNEHFIYFGDSKHLPYGEKSKEAIVEYSLQIVGFLRENNCKAIVIACNSASANAYKEIKAMLPKDFPLFSVVTPVAKHVAYNLNSKVGVIATKATISSEIYKREIRRFNRYIKVVSYATPLLVPMIEEGFYKNNISREIIDSYLSIKKFSDIDTIILGCTHYPLIENEINDFFGGRVQIINSARIVAYEVFKKLESLNLLTNTAFKEENIYYVSDYTKSFQKTAKVFMNKNINLKQIDL